MYTDDLMNSKSEFWSGSPLSFPWRGEYEFASFEGSNEEKWVGNRRKKFYGEMQRNVIWGGGVCENPVGLSMYDGLMETIEYIWVNIWRMLELIIGFRHTVNHCGIHLIN